MSEEVENLKRVGRLERVEPGLSRRNLRSAVDGAINSFDAKESSAKRKVGRAPETE
jgi:hypothetical protein